MSKVITAPSPLKDRRQRAADMLSAFPDVAPEARAQFLEAIRDTNAPWRVKRQAIERLGVDTETSAALWDTWTQPEPWEEAPSLAPAPSLKMEKIPLFGDLATTLPKPEEVATAPAPAPSRNIPPTPKPMSMAKDVRLEDPRFQTSKPPDVGIPGAGYVQPNKPVSPSDVGGVPNIVLPPLPAIKPVKVAGIRGNAVVFDDGTEAVQDARNLAIYKEYGYHELTAEDVAKLRLGTVPAGVLPTPDIESPEALKQRIVGQEHAAIVRQGGLKPVEPTPVALDKISNIKNVILKTVGNIAPAISETAAIAFHNFLLPDYQKKNRPVEANPLYQAGQDVRETLESVFPADPRLQESFAYTQVPQGLASVGSQIIATIVGGPAAGIGVMASQMGADAYREAMHETQDQSKAFKAFLANVLISGTEQIPVSSLLSRLNRLKASGIKEIARQSGLQAGEEGLQEGFQQLLTDLDAIYLSGYKPDMSLKEVLSDVANNAAVGGVVGAIVGGGGAGLTNAMTRTPQTAPWPAVELPKPPEVEAPAAQPTTAAAPTAVPAPETPAPPVSPPPVVPPSAPVVSPEPISVPATTPIVSPEPEVPPAAPPAAATTIPPPPKRFTLGDKNLTVIGSYQGRAVMEDGSLLDPPNRSYMPMLKGYGFPELTAEQITSLTGAPPIVAAPPRSRSGIDLSNLPADVTYVGPQLDERDNVQFEYFNLQMPDGKPATFVVRSGQDVAEMAAKKRQQFAEAAAGPVPVTPPSQGTAPPVAPVERPGTVLPAEFIHGTSPEAAELIKQTGRFTTGGVKRNYTYSELGPDTVYFTVQDSPWLTRPETMRAQTYTSFIKSKVTPEAKIEIIDSVDKGDAIAKKAGFNSWDELRQTLSANDLLDYIDTDKPETFSAAQSWEQGIRDGLLATKALRDAGIDGIWIPEGMSDVLDVADAQLAVFNPTVIRPAEMPSAVEPKAGELPPALEPPSAAEPEQATIREISENELEVTVRNPKNSADAIRIARERLAAAGMEGFEPTITKAVMVPTRQGVQAQDIRVEFERKPTEEAVPPPVAAPPARVPDFKIGDRATADEGTGRVVRVSDPSATSQRVKLALEPDGRLTNWIPKSRVTMAPASETVTEPITPKEPVATGQKFKYEVITDASGKWTGNEKTYPSREAAEAAAADLQSRWTAVRQWRVVPVEESAAPPPLTPPTIEEPEATPPASKPPTAPPPSTPEPLPAPPRKFGTTNTEFVEDEMLRRKERMRKKSGTQLNMGFDPEYMADMFYVGGYYFEGGIRELGAWSAKMVEELGETVRPYLKSIHESIRVHFEEVEARKGLPNVPTTEPTPGERDVPGEAGGAPSGTGSGQDAAGDGEAIRQDEPGERPGEGVPDGKPAQPGTRRPAQRRDVEQQARQRFSLIDKTPVDLTPQQRREINRRATEIAQEKKVGDPLTAEEQDILRQYTGHGGLGEATEGVLFEHYTSYRVVEWQWSKIRMMGYPLDNASILEPSAGVGNYLGFAPPGAKLTAVEIDPIAAKITQLLYPDAHVENKPFEQFNTRQRFDIVISNVPFSASRGELRYDKDAEAYKDITTLHDFFFIKSLDLTKPNGLVVFLTSTGTMDKDDPKIRQLINEKAEFLGAYRTPAGEFKKNTQYGGSVDAIFLRRRTPEEIQAIADGRFEYEPLAQQWVKAQDTTQYSKPDQPAARLSSYYLENPGQMWGEPQAGYGVRQVTRIGVKPTQPVEVFMVRSLADPIVWQPRETSPVPPAADESLVAVGRAPAGTRTGTMILHKDTITYAAKDGNLYEAFPKTLPPATATRIRSAMRIMELIDGLYNALRVNDIALADKIRPNLKQATENYISQYKKPPGYDPYVWRFLNGGTEANPYPFADPRVWMMAGVTDDEGRFSHIFTTNTIWRPPVQPRDYNARDLKDVANFVYEQTGVLDRDRIQELYKGRLDGTVDAGLVGVPGFSVVDLTAEGPVVDTDEEYLYGAIWPKIDKVQELMKSEHVTPEIQTALDRQMEALTQALPEQATMDNLPIDPFASFVDESTISAWLQSVGMQGVIQYEPSNNRHMWAVGGRGRIQLNVVVDPKTGATEDREFVAQQVEDFLNHKRATMKVGTGEVDDRGREKTRTVFDVRTQEIQDQIVKSFHQWAQQNPRKLEHLVPVYNRMYRSFRHRTFDGTEQTIEGLAATFKGKPLEVHKHQWEVIAQMLHARSGINAHGVGLGKAQSLDSQLLTPDGWVRMGDIEIGDHVIAVDGSPTTVIGVFPQGEKDIYRVDFSDGSSTECCDEHLWQTQTYYERSKSSHGSKLGKQWECAKPKIRPLFEIKHTLTARLGAKNHSIPLLKGPAQLNHKDTPLNPYLVGVLLGDGGVSTGHSVKVSLGETKREIKERCEQLLPPLTKLVPVNGSDCDYSITRTSDSGSNSCIDALRTLGLMGCHSYSKFIPDLYKFNSMEVRLEVLRGLMDTDGHVEKHGTSTFFDTSSQRLAEDVRFIVNSLGGTATINPKEITPYSYKGEIRYGRCCYRMTLSLPPNINPFHLLRKAKLVVPKSRYLPVRYITNVTHIGKKPAQCILVDHPDHLYVTDHCIVTHNTLSSIIMAQLAKQLGIVRKPMFVVPAKVIKNWGYEINQAFPGAVVLDTSNMSAKNRNKTLHRVASSDADFTLVTFEGMKEIPLRAAEQYIQEDLREFAERLYLARKANDKKTVNELEDQIRKMGERLAALQDMKKTNAIFFEDLGVDSLIVDEAHSYKNAPVAYADMASYLNAAKHSDRAADMAYKTRYIHERRGGRRGQNVWGLTATPTPNNPIEIYSMMRYIAPDEWTDRNIRNAGDFVEQFGIVGAIEEPGTTGVPKIRTVFLGYKNLRDLRAIFRRYVDMRLASATAVKRPDVQYVEHVMSPTPSVIFEAARIAELDEYVRQNPRQAKMEGWIPLSVLTLARKLAADLSIYNPYRYWETLGQPGTKLHEVIQRVKDGEQGDNTQLIFVDLYRATTKVEVGSRAEEIAKRFVDGRSKDLSGLTIEDDSAKLATDSDEDSDEDDDTTTPEQEPAPQDPHRRVHTKTYELVNIHKEIRKALIKAGIPEDQIAIINQGSNNTAAKKFKIQQRNAEGKVRFLIGTTASMGEGMNLQANTTDIHHYDVPWTPSALEQREGRGVRQGNKQDLVRVHRYVGKGTSDAKMYAILHRKARWNEDLWFGDADEVMDFDQDHRNYADIAAEAQIDESTLTYWQMARSVAMNAARLEEIEAEDGSLAEARRMIAKVEAEVQERRGKIEQYQKQIQEGRGSDYIFTLIDQHSEAIQRLEIDLDVRRTDAKSIEDTVVRLREDLDRGREVLRDLIAEMRQKGFPILPEHEALIEEAGTTPDTTSMPEPVAGPQSTPGPKPSSSGASRDLSSPSAELPPVVLAPPLVHDNVTYPSIEVWIPTADRQKIHTVSGWEIAPGLAITKHLGDPRRYTITHVSSGAAVTHADSIALAVSKAKRIATVTDWTRSAEDLESDKSFHPALGKILHGEAGVLRLFRPKPALKTPQALITSPLPEQNKAFHLPNPVPNIWDHVRKFPSRVYRFISPLIYNADIQMWPIFNERIRRAQEMAYDAAGQTADKLKWVTHGLDTSEFEVLRRIVYNEDMYETAVRNGEDSIPLELNSNYTSKLDQLDYEINRLRSIATPATLQAIDRHHQWMEEIWDDLVKRGKVEPDQGRVKYFPNMILRFGDDMTGLPGLPLRMQNPRRMYLKERTGHQQLHDADYIRVMEQYGTRVYLHNMIDDFIEATSNEYDIRYGRNPELPRLTAAELSAMLAKTKGVLKPDEVYEAPNGQRFKVFQFTTGRTLYPVRAIDNSVINDALKAGIDELPIDIEAQRQKPTTHGLPQLETVMGEQLTYPAIALGGHHKMYLLPIEVTEKLKRFREDNQHSPFSEMIRVATKVLKAGYLHMALFSWQAQNIFSNELGLYLESIDAFARQPEAMKLLRGKLTGPQYDDFLRLIHDARIWNSTFTGTGGAIPKAINAPELRPFRSASTSPLEKLNPFGDNPVGDLLRAYESKLRFIEAVPKVAFALENYRRVMKGLPVKTTGVSLAGLDPRSMLAVGRAGRNINVDYASTARYMQFAQQTVFPFMTFYVKTAPIVYRAMVHKGWLFPGDEFTAKILSLYVALYIYNHYFFPDVEDEMDWQKEMMHLNTGLKDDRGRDVIIGFQTQFDIAASWVGLDTLTKNLDKYRRGEWTAEQAAEQQLQDIFGYQERSHWPFRAAPGAVLKGLLNPMVQAMMDLYANKDSFTGQEIVPAELWGRRDGFTPDNPDGVRLQREYLIKKFFSPYMQYLRAEVINDADDPIWNWATETGPFAWRKLFGIRYVTPGAGDINQWYEDRQWQQSLYASKMLRVRDAFVNHAAGLIQTAERDAMVTAANAMPGGASVTIEDIGRMVQSPLFNIEVIDAKLRIETDPAERRKLEIERATQQNRLGLESFQGTPRRVRELIGPRPPALPRVPAFIGPQGPIVPAPPEP